MSEAELSVFEMNESKSSFYIGERENKTAFNKFGWRRLNSFPTDKACLVFFNGDGAVTPQHANGAAKGLVSIFSDHPETVMEEGGLGFSILGSYYRFEEGYTASNARERMSADAFQTVRKEASVETEEEMDPAYAREAYRILLQPRISENGKRLELKEACRRLRQVVFALYCHGAYAYLKMEEILNKKMTELGYSEKEQLFMKKHITAIACASPVIPVGATKTHFLSIVSLADKMLPYDNRSSLKLDLMALNGTKRYGIHPCWFNVSSNENLLVMNNLVKGEMFPMGTHNFSAYISRKTEVMPDDAKDVTLFVRRIFQAAMEDAIQSEKRYIGAPASFNVMYQRGGQNQTWTSEMPAKTKKVTEWRKNALQSQLECFFFYPTPGYSPEKDMAPIFNKNMIPTDKYNR